MSSGSFPLPPASAANVRMFQWSHQKPTLTNSKQSSLWLTGISSSRVSFPFLCKYMQDGAGSKKFYPLGTLQIASEATSLSHTSSSFSNPLNSWGVSKPLKFARNFLVCGSLSLLPLLTKEWRSWRKVIYLSKKAATYFPRFFWLPVLSCCDVCAYLLVLFGFGFFFPKLPATYWKYSLRFSHFLYYDILGYYFYGLLYVLHSIP